MNMLSESDASGERLNALEQFVRTKITGLTTTNLAHVYDSYAANCDPLNISRIILRVIATELERRGPDSYSNWTAACRGGPVSPRLFFETDRGNSTTTPQEKLSSRSDFTEPEPSRREGDPSCTTLEEWANGIPSAKYFWCFIDVALLLNDILPSLAELAVVAQSTNGKTIRFRIEEITQAERAIRVEIANQFFQCRPIFRDDHANLYHSARNPDMLRAAMP